MCTTRKKIVGLAVASATEEQEVLSSIPESDKKVFPSGIS